MLLKENAFNKVVVSRKMQAPSVFAFGKSTSLSEGGTYIRFLTTYDAIVSPAAGGTNAELAGIDLFGLSFSWG